MRYLSSHSESGLGWVKQNVSLKLGRKCQMKYFFTTCKKRKQKYKQVLVNHLNSTYQGSCE